MLNPVTVVTRIGLFVAGVLCIASAHAITWPQVVVAEQGSIIVYQPQPEKLDGNALSGRAAMSMEFASGADSIFGTFWFDATIATDYDTDTVLIRDLKVTKVRWPDSKDAHEQRFTAVVENAIPEAGFEISLERLSASLESAEIERESLEALNTQPPEILFAEVLSVLLLYDGQPRFADVDGSPYERALNAPFLVVRQGRDHYLSSGKFWYRADAALGPWQPTTTPPADLVALVADVETDEAQPERPPAIVAADEPTELIVTQGKPDWQSLTGGQLLYVQNTETPWIRELSTGNMYVLLSGRWYRSKSASGPWTFVRADELPDSFSDIPPASDIGGLRTSVAGTPEADDAILDAHIPQTAAIKRDEVTLTIEYDGAPKFEKIAGTSVAYAVNTGAQVLEIDDRYYAVDNGVWFTSAKATGPWVVADSIPEQQIQEIPPSAPVYNTTHVHVYDSSPEVVYVGYTPGYMWSFPYYGVPVYGTGFYYPPYWGNVYYPRVPTWGFHVGYNPWTGWNFGMSWSNGFFSFGMSWGGGYGGAYRPWGCCGGWYGGGYRGPTIINTGDINIGNSVNIGNRNTIGNRIDRSDRVNVNNRRTNIYNRPENRARNVAGGASPDIARARPAANRANDVYADRNGNVAKRVDDQWQAREGGQWNPEQATQVAQETRDRARADAASRDLDRSSLDRGSLDRARASRDHGMSREARRPQSGGRGGRVRRG